MYPDIKGDTFAMFISRATPLTAPFGMLGFVVPYVWMFISSYRMLRECITSQSTITSLVQLEYNAFEPACVPISVFTLLNRPLADFKGDYIKLSDFKGHQTQAPRTLEAIRNPNCGWRYTATTSDFNLLPGSPVAYWVKPTVRQMVAKARPLSDVCDPRKGMVTADNPRFIRFWFEVDLSTIGFSIPSREAAVASQCKWFPYQKGGTFRKWFGNIEAVVNWENDGYELLHMKGEGYANGSTNHNLEYIFKPALVWTKITSSTSGFRFSPSGFLFDDASGLCAIRNQKHSMSSLGFLNSPVAVYILQALNPTMNLNPGNLATLPYLDIEDRVDAIVSKLIAIGMQDWYSSETTWEFGTHPLLECKSTTIAEAFVAWKGQCDANLSAMQMLEEENNRAFIEAYGLVGEIAPEVADDQITLYRPDQEEDIKRLFCYAIGCIMGRYSLDKPGLVYAHCGNEGFDAAKYKTFLADDDGIIPLLETDWGIRDDATNRFVEFIGVAWPKEHLEENLKFIADSLGPTGSEQPRATIRRYLSTGFYKHHLPMYKKRPIYWLFSSGKQRAFQCLVYLHRYHEGTLARMRTEYVIPLQGQIAARIEQLEGDKSKATSTSHRNKLQKEQTDLKKQQAELLTFEEKLKHAADQKISLDLDDGVKVNYAKFGDLLAESKAITGGKEEE